jgi:hypothetical protein
MLKKLFLLSSVLLIGVSSQAQFVLKATPLVILKNQIVNISGEFAIPTAPDFTFTVGLANNFVYKGELTDSLLILNNARSFKGLSIEPELKYYWAPRKNQFEGFYTGIFSSFRYSTSFYDEVFNVNGIQTPTNGSIRQNTLVSVVGLEIGYQFLLGPRKDIAIDLFAGLGSKHTIYNRYGYSLQNHSIESTSSNGIATRGNISVGYIIQ